jgi:ABC-type phosphonate transport system ATPase subunit
VRGEGERARIGLGSIEGSYSAQVLGVVGAKESGKTSLLLAVMSHMTLTHGVMLVLLCTWDTTKMVVTR